MAPSGPREALGPAALDVSERAQQAQSIFSTFGQNGVKPQLPRSLEDRRERWRKLFKVTEMAKQFCSRQRVSLGTCCPAEAKIRARLQESHKIKEAKVFGGLERAKMQLVIRKSSNQCHERCPLPCPTPPTAGPTTTSHPRAPPRQTWRRG